MKPFPALLVAAAFGTSCSKAPHPAKPSPTALPAAAVTTETTTLTNIPLTEEIVGTVRAVERTTVEAKVSGRIATFAAPEGTEVKAGDVLAVLEAREINARAEQASASLEQAQRDFARQQQLLKGGATTRQEFEAAESRVKLATASLSEAETMLGYTRITAPADGVVTRKFAGAGDLAVPGKPILAIESRGTLRLEADVPEALISKVTIGNPMRVLIPSTSHSMMGTVREIAPSADSISRTFTIKLELPPTEALRSGQFGRVAVPTGSAPRLLIPSSAITKRGQMETVFMALSGKASLRLVRTGRTSGERTEVISGIDAGETVIISPQASLSDGQPITFQP
jgi:membrane fusion protein (multidrug efflux system)